MARWSSLLHGYGDIGEAICSASKLNAPKACAWQIGGLLLVVGRLLLILQNSYIEVATKCLL